VHGREDELFYVLEGEMDVYVGKEVHLDKIRIFRGILDKNLESRLLRKRKAYGWRRNRTAESFTLREQVPHP
jgi:hypothetical protein